MSIRDMILDSRYAAITDVPVAGLQRSWSSEVPSDDKKEPPCMALCFREGRTGHVGHCPNVRGNKERVE